MKKLSLLFIFIGATLFAQTNEETVITAIDGYAARVDNRIITYGDVRESVLPVIQQITEQYRGKELAEAIKNTYLEARESLIEEALFQEETKRLGYKLPEHIIDEEVNNLIRTRFDNDRVKLNKALAQRRMTYQEWRGKLADQLTMRIYYDREVLQRATVSDDAVRQRYEEIKEDHIIPFRVKYRFILINKGTTEEEQAVKREQAENTLKKLQTGADFMSVAQKVSEGDISLSPWRDPEDVREEMRPALYHTPAGQVSDLIETDSVYYIIKVESRQEESYVPFDDLKEPIKADLLAKERERLHNRLVNRLAARHYVKRY